MDPENRAAINMDGVSVWLDVPLDELVGAAARPTAAVRWPPIARRWSACMRCGRPRMPTPSSASMRRRASRRIRPKAVAERDRADSKRDPIS